MKYDIPHREVDSKSKIAQNEFHVKKLEDADKRQKEPEFQQKTDVDNGPLQQDNNLDRSIDDVQSNVKGANESKTEIPSLMKSDIDNGKAELRSIMKSDIDGDLIQHIPHFEIDSGVTKPEVEPENPKSPTNPSIKYTEAMMNADINEDMKIKQAESIIHSDIKDVLRFGNFLSVIQNLSEDSTDIG